MESKNEVRYNKNMNYEIELKAHVYNRDEVIKILNEKARYCGAVEKSDTYYKFPSADISARIRREVHNMDGECKNQTVFTYKRKEVKKDSNGLLIEVNDENECIVDDGSALEVFFEDLGAKISLKKEKKVLHWHFLIDGNDAHVELCTVPPLGDFLEIEIIKNENSEEIVESAKKSIQKIFTLCNIPLENIETRYYRDMLSDLQHN